MTNQNKNKKILAIETSCDETAAAVLSFNPNKEAKVVSSVISSQAKLHQSYGGVFPSLAKREHQKNLTSVLKQALKQAGMLKKRSAEDKEEKKISQAKEILIREEDLFKTLKRFLTIFEKPEIDFIAVTIGPGLEPCLWQGINFTKALAFYWNLPVIPVNHLEAHILVNFVGKNQKEIKKLMPAVCLIVSGGHTQLVLTEEIGQYRVLGQTKDDAAGECFDKTARILGLGYPGGPAIAKAAKQTKSNKRKYKISLPLPMLNSKNYDFSFSGLKTAVLYDWQKRKKMIQNSSGYINAMAYEIERVIAEILIKKTIKAAKDFRAKSIILGGGVTANKYLRSAFKKNIKQENYCFKLILPDKKQSTDNAAMIAAAACFHLKNKKSWNKIKANANLKL